MAQSLEERLRSRLAEAVTQAAESVSTQAVSGYLVKRLIQEGSFTNVKDAAGATTGFRVKVKNRLGVATIVGCDPLKIDGEIFDPGVITIEKNRKSYCAAELSETLPLGVSFGDELTITVQDAQGLESGEHDIELALKMVGLGLVQAKYKDKLTGEGAAAPRVKKKSASAESSGEGGSYSELLRRTVEMAAGHIGAASLAERSKTLDVIVLDMKDADEKYSVKLTSDGRAEFVEGAASGGSVLVIKTTKTAFHDMAHGKLNAGIAYARGDIKLEGIPLLKLRGMDKLITAIFRGYRAASDGVEFDSVPESIEGGILEQALGAAFSVFDEVLKGLDKALGAFGMKFFYEKSLNRIELVWDALDKEMRRMLSFGREEAEEEPKAPKPRAAAPVAKKSASSPAPAKSLQDRLRDRISSVIETAVIEMSRSSVSGYLVKRLVVPGSFKNFMADGEVAGFEVKLKNKLGVATVIGFTDVKVDGESFGLDLIEITKGSRKVAASEVSDKAPLSVSFGDELTIRVKRAGGITPGRHKISLGVDMVGLGGMDVDYEEELSA